MVAKIRPYFLIMLNGNVLFLVNKNNSRNRKERRVRERQTATCLAHGSEEKLSYAPIHVQKACPRVLGE